MKNEEYAEFPELIEEPEGETDEGMSCSDVMILLTQYRSAPGKYHGSHL